MTRVYTKHSIAVHENGTILSGGPPYAPAVVAKRHHWLPQFYLSRWADANGRVLVLDNQEERSFVTSVENAAVQGGYYAIDTEDGPSDEVETQLSEIEGLAAQAFLHIDQGEWPLPDHERDMLANFLALQLTRGPDLRQLSNHITTEVSRMWGQIAASKPEFLRRKVIETTGNNPSHEELLGIAKFLSSDFTYNLAQNQHVSTMLTIASDLVQPVGNMAWHLTLSEGEFITGDVPIARWASPGKLPPWAGVGLYTADEVTFPVDRHRCLILRFLPGEEDQRGVIGRDEVEAINDRTQKGCQRFTFSCPGSG